MKKLSSVINKYTKDDLYNTLKIYNINKKGNKKDLIDLLVKKITNKSIMEKKIKTLLPDEIYIIKELLKNNGKCIFSMEHIDSCLYIEKLMIIDIEIKDEQIFINLPEEVYELLKSIKIDELNDFKRSKQIYNLTKVLVNHYGVVSFDDLINNYNYYYNEEIKIDDTILSFDERNNSIEYFTDDDREYFVYEDILRDKGLFDMIVDRHKDIKRKSITLEELNVLGSDDYIPNCKEINDMKDFLISIGNDNIINDIDYVMYFIYECCKYSINYYMDAFDLLDSYGIKDIDNYIDEISKYYFEIYKIGYLWINNGYQTDEFNKLYPDKMIDEYILDKLDDDDCDCDHDCDCGHHHK